MGVKGREMDEGGQKVQISSYKIVNSGYVMHNRTTGNSIVHWKVTKRIDLKHSHHKGKTDL